MASSTIGGTGSVAKRTNRYDFATSITVLVGADEVPFLAHTAIICESSDYFDSAMTWGWQEWCEKAVRLPRVDPTIFVTYLSWLYTGDIDLSEYEEIPAVPKYDELMGKRKFALLAQQLKDLYYLGFELQDIQFRNSVIDEFSQLCEDSNSLPRPAEVTALWSRAPKGSKMADLLVDYFATDYDSDTFDQEAYLYPFDFVSKVTKARAEAKEIVTPPCYKPTCFYHEHKTDKDQCKFY